jgi:hypothetical protein
MPSTSKCNSQVPFCGSSSTLAVTSISCLAPPFPIPSVGKEEFYETLRYFTHQIKKLEHNLTLKLGTEVRHHTPLSV